MGKGHIPIRTCISCGIKTRKGNLIRLVVDRKGQVVRDEPGKMPGRGAYVCRNRSCWLKLSGKHRLGRAFRSRQEQIITL